MYREQADHKKYWIQPTESVYPTKNQQLFQHQIQNACIKNNHNY